MSIPISLGSQTPNAMMFIVKFGKMNAIESKTIFNEEYTYMFACVVTFLSVVQFFLILIYFSLTLKCSS